MKRTLTLILALMFVLALFAGCGGQTGNTPATASPTAPATSAPATSAPADGGGEVAPPEDTGPYKFAKGKYETDAEGWPLEKYVYELPISTTDEVLTQMTLNFSPQYLPEEGYAGIPTYAQAGEMTGVHIEYNILPMDSYSTTLSILEASEDLDDIIGGFYAYHSGTSLSRCIEDEQIVNIYDYKDYCPNYCRWAQDFKWIDKQWGAVNNPGMDKWIGFVNFYDQPCQTTGYFIRQDWMDDLGLGEADGFSTFQEWHDILLAMKTAGKCEYPLIVYSNLDAYANVWNAFDTTPYAGASMWNRVVDGKVSFNGTTEDDKALMQYLNGWYNEGLIDPNFGAYTTTDSLREPLTNNRIATSYFNPSEVLGWESSSIDPDCRWEPNLRLRKTEDQIIHWNLDPDEFGGTGSSIAATCENIPLAVSFIDWCYSDFGAEWMNWGPEGYGWDYNENGEKQWNELVTGFDLGVGWATMCYFFNPMDAGINMWTRNYYYPGGERLRDMFAVWDKCLDYYDGAYNYPATIKIGDEDAAEINTIRGDLDTFFSENYVLFFDGSKPFAEWDSFQQQYGEMGMNRITEIYQRYYDAYIAEQA